MKQEMPEPIPGSRELPAPLRAVPADARVLVGPCTDEHLARVALQAFAAARRLLLLTPAPPPPGVARLAHENPRVRLVSAATPEALAAGLEQALERDMLLFAEGRVGLINTLPHWLAASGHGAWQRQVLEFTRFLISSSAMRATRGWHRMANKLLNIERAAVSPPLRALAGSASGRPVVVMGAGPSLDGTVGELADRPRHAVLVACDAAFSTLRAHGVRPDYVVSTDDVEDVWRFFAGALATHGDVPVVTCMTGCWALARHWPGPLYFAATGEESATLPLELTPLNTGSCVGHAAYELACLLGGGPIILTGFDLAYREHAFHPAHSDNPYFDARQPTARAELVEVEGMHGGPVKTPLAMQMYLREFERRFLAASVPVWDATEGGALKAGTRVVTLRAALDETAGGVLSDASAPSPQPAGDPSRMQAWKARLLEEAGLFADEVAALRQAGSPVWRERGQTPLSLLERYGALRSVLAETDNVSLRAAAIFAWEDWMAGGGGGALPAPVEHYLGYLTGYARIIPQVAGFPRASTSGGGRMLLLVGTEQQIDAARPLLEALGQKGRPVAVLPADPQDFEFLWQAIEHVNAGVLLSVDGSVGPAAWALPALGCLDWRTSPPPSVPERHCWLPGYTVVCAGEELADSWRAYLPSDCPLYTLPDLP